MIWRPAGSWLAGFRCTGERDGLRPDVPESAADSGRGEPAGGAGHSQGRLLGLAVLILRKDLAKDAELLVLRHQNAVLRRHVGWIRYEPADQVWFAALARLIPRRCWTEILPVMPATLLAWHPNWRGESTTRAGSASPAHCDERIGTGHFLLALYHADVQAAAQMLARPGAGESEVRGAITPVMADTGPES